MLERSKNAIVQRKYVGAVLTDLSKAFDCLNRQLLIAKLAAKRLELLYIITSQTDNKGQK